MKRRITIIIATLILSFATATTSFAAVPKASKAQIKAYNSASFQSITNSSALSEIGYSKSTKTLYVTFVKSGATYGYLNVPESEYNGLKKASSKGSYYNKEIKGYYDCIRIN